MSVFLHIMPDYCTFYVIYHGASPLEALYSSFYTESVYIALYNSCHLYTGR
jgi:hypothetical protein